MGVVSGHLIDSARVPRRYRFDIPLAFRRMRRSGLILEKNRPSPRGCFRRVEKEPIAAPGGWCQPEKQKDSRELVSSGGSGRQRRLCAPLRGRGAFDPYWRASRNETSSSGESSWFRFWIQCAGG